MKYPKKAKLEFYVDEEVKIEFVKLCKSKLICPTKALRSWFLKRWEEFKEENK